MKREETIKKLEHYRYCLKFQYGWYSKEDDKVFDMAIKALEQEPCEDMEREYEKAKALFGKVVKSEDCISRQGVINAIANTCSSCQVMIGMS